MSIMYCTFWYPTIYHEKIKRLSRKITPKTVIEDISDKSLFPYKVYITLDGQENLIIDSETTKNSFRVTLVPTDQRRNGFIQYFFDTKNIPLEHLESFIKILKKDVYHKAKEFYHVHEADSGKDSALRAIISNKKEELNCIDNRFIISLLKSFVPVFKKYAISISACNAQAHKREIKIEAIEKVIRDRKIELSTKQEELLARHKEAILKYCLIINKKCENASIEYTYCKKLLSSKYNKSFLHSLEIDYTAKNKESKKIIEKKENLRRSV